LTGRIVAVCADRDAGFSTPIKRRQFFGLHGAWSHRRRAKFGGDWEAYRAHGDATVLATARARTVRSIFRPTLIAALDDTRTQANRLAFADALEAVTVSRFTADTA
jgi:hypothetical protein